MMGEEGLSGSGVEQEFRRGGGGERAETGNIFVVSFP